MPSLEDFSLFVYDRNDISFEQLRMEGTSLVSLIAKHLFCLCLRDCIHDSFDTSYVIDGISTVGDNPRVLASEDEIMSFFLVKPAPLFVCIAFAVGQFQRVIHSSRGYSSSKRRILWRQPFFLQAFYDQIVISKDRLSSLIDAATRTLIQRMFPAGSSFRTYC